MSYTTERRLSPEELKQRNNTAMMQALDTEKQVTLTEKNWNGLLTLQQNILRTLEDMLTKDDLTYYLNQILNINEEHLSWMEQTEKEFLEQAGSLSGAFSSGSSAICNAAKESVKSIGNEARSSLRELSAETRQNIQNMLDKTKKQIRTNTILCTVWTMLLAGLCALLHILK